MGRNTKTGGRGDRGGMWFCYTRGISLCDT